MIDRMTIEIPAEFKEALRTERFEKRTTYREIIAQMFAARYGLNSPMKAEQKKSNGTKSKP